MRRVRRIAVTPTIGTDAYTALDVVGGLMTFAITDQGFDGMLSSVLVTDDACQSEAYTLYFFESQPSAITDGTIFDPTLADMKKLVTGVAIGTADWAEVGSVDWVVAGGHPGTPMRVPVHSDNGNLYMYAVAVGTPEQAGTVDLTFTPAVEIF